MDWLSGRVSQRKLPLGKNHVRDRSVIEDPQYLTDLSQNLDKGLSLLFSP